MAPAPLPYVRTASFIAPATNVTTRRALLLFGDLGGHGSGVDAAPPSTVVGSTSSTPLAHRGRCDLRPHPRLPLRERCRYLPAPFRARPLPPCPPTRSVQYGCQLAHFCSPAPCTLPEATSIAVDDVAEARPVTAIQHGTCLRPLGPWRPPIVFPLPSPPRQEGLTPIVHSGE